MPFGLEVTFTDTDTETVTVYRIPYIVSVDRLYRLHDMMLEMCCFDMTCSFYFLFSIYHFITLINHIISSSLQSLRVTCTFVPLLGSWINQEGKLFGVRKLVVVPETQGPFRLYAILLAFGWSADPLAVLSASRESVVSVSFACDLTAWHVET